MTKQLRFRDLTIGQCFDWINPAPEFITSNSFFEQCRKISDRKYVGLTNNREYRVGSINAKVFNAEPGKVLA